VRPVSSSAKVAPIRGDHSDRSIILLPAGAVIAGSSCGKPAFGDCGLSSIDA
jgi:hypothetical protein